jgi:hypothetical protein
VNAHAQAFGAAQADIVRYPDVTEFNQNAYAGAIGVQGQWERLSWRVGAAAGYQSLDRDPYRRTHGLFSDGSYSVNDRNAVSLGVQSGQFKYFGSNTVRNARFDTLLAGWRHLFAPSWRPEIELTGSLGREENNLDDRQDLSRDLYGVRLALACTPRPGWTFAASVVHQRSDYQDPDPILLTTREDRYTAGDFSVAWSAIGPLQVRAEFSVVKNDSNLELYAYRRNTALLRARYEFR